MKQRWILSCLVAAVAVLAVQHGARASDTADPTPDPSSAPSSDSALDQTLSDLEIVHGTRVLETGHVDMGPAYDDGEWTFLIHDDVAKADPSATSVWRYPDETVLRVRDSARLTRPEDPAYDFTGARPGAPVWVIPQTQDPDVVWLGWNTQDPEVMETIDRGVTLSLTGVEGPGTMTVYLQSGTFGEPDVLWDSRTPDVQPAWVDVNTHTHANWVFTEPGVYLVRLRAEADLRDGTRVADDQVLRFAVGDATAPEDALSAAWQGGDAPPAPTAGDQPVVAPQEQDDAVVPLLVGSIVVAAVGLVVAVTATVVRGNRARRAALDQAQR